MGEDDEGLVAEGRGGRLKRQLKRVKKRKRARRFDFECEVVTSKMRLVKIGSREGDE